MRQATADDLTDLILLLTRVYLGFQLQLNLNKTNSNVQVTYEFKRNQPRI